MNVRLLTWNIHKGVGGVDRRYVLERTIELIHHLAPDIAFLQEVAQDWPGARREDQVERLKEALGLSHMAFAPEHRFRFGGYGNAIFSRFPLRDIHHLDLTIDWRKKRGALLARAIVKSDDADGHAHQKSVLLSNLHLGLAGSERSQQLERFFEKSPYASAHQTTPFVVAGDLNDLFGTLGPKHLVPRGFVRAGQAHRTFPAFAPLRPLDAIFFRGEAEVVSAGLGHGPHARRASDHLPLIADLKLPGE
jgi:endonuclease/exonuclease/phosphatase family metal-dependent hydrolase